MGKRAGSAVLDGQRPSACTADHPHPPPCLHPKQCARLVCSAPVGIAAVCTSTLPCNVARPAIPLLSPAPKQARAARAAHTVRTSAPSRTTCRARHIYSWSLHHLQVTTLYTNPSSGGGGQLGQQTSTNKLSRQTTNASSACWGRRRRRRPALPARLPVALQPARPLALRAAPELGAAAAGATHERPAAGHGRGALAAHRALRRVGGRRRRLPDRREDLGSGALDVRPCGSAQCV
jgi:hypothetical protein